MSDRSSSVISSWHEQDITHDDVTVHVHREGDPAGPTLMLAHGLSDSGRCWWRVVEALGEDLDLVMLDARNHGQSSTVIDSTSTPVDDVGAVIDALGLDRPMLMGIRSARARWQRSLLSVLGVHLDSCSSIHRSARPTSSRWVWIPLAATPFEPGLARFPNCCSELLTAWSASLPSASPGEHWTWLRHRSTSVHSAGRSATATPPS